MKLYFAGDGWDDELIKHGGNNKLVSYPYWCSNKATRENITKFKGVFMDSGGFSVFTGNATIDIETMVEDYRSMPKTWVLAGLDVIGNAKETKKNCDYMTKKGIKVLPTYHYGGDVKYLKSYCKKNYDYIALGGVAQLRTPKRISQWLNMCYGYIKDYMPIKVHGFAITSERLLKQYPFYSVDSTSWQSIVRYGYGGDRKTVQMQSYKRNHSEMLKHSIVQLLELETKITNLWKKRGVIWK